MAIKGEWIRYGDQAGYLARPPKGADGAGVILPLFGDTDFHCGLVLTIPQ
jgi:hypothetical protein